MDSDIVHEAIRTIYQLGMQRGMHDVARQGENARLALHGGCRNAENLLSSLESAFPVISGNDILVELAAQLRQLSLTASQVNGR